MKQLLCVVFSLVLIATIIPASSAVEWHSGTWLDNGNDVGYDATNLASGGTWQKTGSGIGYWACYDVGNTSLYLKSWSAGEIIQAPSTGFQMVGSTSCGMGDYYNGIFYGNKTDYYEVVNTNTRYRYWMLFSGSMALRSVSDVKLYWNTLPDLDVDFNATPTTGPSPLSVSFTALNQSNTTGNSWAFGDGNITTYSGSTISHIYQNPGEYTVILNYYNNSYVAKSVQKNNYIIVGSPNATKTQFYQTIDGTNGNIVVNSSIQLNDVENSSWVNGTFPADGMSSITTLEGHHINAYAQSLGYSDSDDLNILNDGNPRYIMMWPTFAKNVSSGNVSLYVTVQDKDTHAPIKGAGVTISPQTGPAQGTMTNDAGIAYFIVTNNTMVLITATAPGMGYKPATTTINTGIGSGGSASAAATILLSKGLVTPTFPTVTTLPGGGTPTPTVTVLPGCEDQISPEGQAKCRAAQSNQGLSFLGANMYNLIALCVAVTMLYLLGFKLGR